MTRRRWRHCASLHHHSMRASSVPVHAAMAIPLFHRDLSIAIRVHSGKTLFRHGLGLGKEFFLADCTIAVFVGFLPHSLTRINTRWRLLRLVACFCSRRCRCWCSSRFRKNRKGNKQDTCQQNKGRKLNETHYHVLRWFDINKN